MLSFKVILNFRLPTGFLKNTKGNYSSIVKLPSEEVKHLPYTLSFFEQHLFMYVA